MHKITYFPVGNADTCLITLENGKNILIDFYAVKQGEDNKDELRADVPKLLKEILKEAKKDYIDIVAFTHLDEDHYKGFSDYFYLEQAEKYQADDRIKINELWVPAAIILEKGIPEEAKILRAEARFRLLNNKKIKVFSKPEPLKDWLKDNEIDYETIKENVIHAGTVIPGLNKESDGVEFFVHAPFSDKVDDKTDIDRNNAALTLQATFVIDDIETMLMIGSDTECEVWQDIVKVSKYNKRQDRLKWDIFDIAHHCSITALVQKKEDLPDNVSEEIKWLYEQCGENVIMISQSEPIPNTDTEQPPHNKAKIFYLDTINNKGGEFKVTMEHPSKDKPKPIVINIDKTGPMIEKKNDNPGDKMIGINIRAGINQ